MVGEKKKRNRARRDARATAKAEVHRNTTTAHKSRRSSCQRLATRVVRCGAVAGLSCARGRSRVLQRRPVLKLVLQRRSFCTQIKTSEKRTAHPRLGAEATAAAAAIGLASGKQVGEARVRDVRAAARSALDAADGVTAKQERRDVRSYASATQKLAAAQSVDPAGDARSASREAATAARERLRGDTRVSLYDALSKHTKDPSLAMLAKVR